MNEKLILGIASADRFDGTHDNDGWVDADKVLSHIKSGIIFQDTRLGNAKLNFEFTSDWSIGRDFIGIHVSKDICMLTPLAVHHSHTMILNFKL